MFSRIAKLFFLFVLVLIFVLPDFKVLAEETNKKDLNEICQSIEKIEKECETLSSKECRELLEKCEAYYRKQSEEIEKDITKTKQEKRTLQNQIYILRKKIKNLDYQIYQSNLVIKDISLQISDTESSIEKTSLKIKDSKEKLIAILRSIYEEDRKSVVEILLSESKLSVFFDNLTALEVLSHKNQELLQNIKSLKSYLENQKQALDEEREDLRNAVKIQTLQKQRSAEAKKEQEYFLKLTEKEYQKQIKEKEKIEKKAAEIRARIFELIGVPKAPTFGEALELAEFVSFQTGIRPAFLLAVLTQESNIGKNVGQCYLTNFSTGEGIVAYNGRKVSRVMKPSRDIQPFLSITKELGRDPYNTLVSCPMKYGWGGAMGPGQFIPSTWILYRDKVKAITGKSADPWNIKDAFLATGLYLRDLGGAKNEFRAAMHYFSGPHWSKYEEFYGRSVIALAQKYQKDIELIKAK